jgi:hypothetical protein
MLGREVFYGGEQAAGNEPESNPTAKRLHVGFSLEQMGGEMF